MKLIMFLCISISLLLASNNAEISLLKKEKYTYFKLIEDLIKEKKLKQDSIKKLLNSKQRTVTSNLLKAIDLDYNKNQVELSKFYYNEILTKVSDKIKNTTEAIYISDFLLREERYKEIYEILTPSYCETILKKDKEQKCLYYVYHSKKNLNIETNYEESLLKNHKDFWEKMKK